MSTFSQGASRRAASTPLDPRAGNLTYGIVSSLGRAIVTRVYSEEHPLPYEAQLCEQYGVSRPILREAVKMLSAKGLLASRPKRGTWVLSESHWNLLDPDVLVWLGDCEPDSATLMELLQLRLAVGPEAAALAAKAAGPSERQALSEAVERVSTMERGDHDGLQVEIAFHTALLRASRNRFFAQLIQFTETALRVRARRAGSLLITSTDVEHHLRLARAVLAGDARQAKSLCRQLIMRELDLSLRLTRSRDGGGA